MRRLIAYPGRAKEGANAKKGIFMSLSIFLMFSALLLLAYNISVANTRNSEAFTAQAAMDRMNTQFDGVAFSLSQLPNASLNYNTNGSTFVFFKSMPAQFLNSSSSDFLTFDAFMGGYSYTNTSVNLSNSRPNLLTIYPQNMTVNQTSSTSFTFQPLDNSSGRVVKSYNIDMVINSSPAPMISWNPLNSVSNSSSDAMLVTATASAADGMDSEGAYVNQSALNKLEFTQGSDLMMNITFDQFFTSGMDVSAIASPFTVQRITNGNFFANANNWTAAAGANTVISWVNTGRTGGSEQMSMTGRNHASNSDLTQAVNVSAVPDSSTVDWCYNVTTFTVPGASNTMLIYIQSPTNASPGTLVDTVTLTGTTGSFICRSTAVPSSLFGSAGIYTFRARASLSTGGSGTPVVTVLWDDINWNLTMIPRPITNLSIDYVTGGVVPANISVAVGNEFKRVSTNG